MATKAPIAITADLHFHEHSQFSTSDPVTGINTRLLATYNVFTDIVDKAVARGCRALLIAGDWTHSQESLTLQVLDVSNKALRYAKQAGLPVAVLPGNHDQTQDGRFTSIRALGFDIFMDEVSVYDIAGWRVGAIPWMDDPERVQQAYKAIRKCDFVVAHLGVMGATKGPSDLEIPGGIPSGVVPSQRLTFAGHYHKPQEVPSTSFFYVGSPLQISRGEAGEDKSFVVLEPSGEWSRVPLKGPRFLKLRPSELGAARKEDYVDIIVDDEDVSRVRLIADQKCKSKNVKVIREKPIASAPVSLDVSGLNFKEQLKLWVQSSPLEGVSSKRSLREGMALLSEGNSK